LKYESGALSIRENVLRYTFLFVYWFVSGKWLYKVNLRWITH